MKAIIFLPNGNGDLLMFVPALRRLIKVHGVENIILVIASKLQAEFINAFLEKKIDIIQRFDGYIFPNFRLFIKIFLKKGTIIYAPMLSRKFLHVMFFILLGKKTFVPSTFIIKPFFKLIPFRYSLENFPGHQVNYYVKFVGSLLPFELQGEVNEYEIILPSINSKIRNINSSVGSYKIALGISCGFKERHKIPSPLFFANLINRISEKIDTEWFIFSLSSEKYLTDEFYNSIKSNIKVHNICDSNFISVIEIMSNCDLGISGTTGQGHMMAAAGIPMLVLAGVTEPLESGPYARRVSVLRHFLPCGPCYQENFRFGCSKIRCMDTLNIDYGVDLVEKLIKDFDFGLNWRSEIKKYPISVIQIKDIIYNQNFQINHKI